MKCSKCGYDYPAKETKCPYCGEPNKLGMEWEKEEDETRKETLLTKAKVLHSMPLYVANKIMKYHSFCWQFVLLVVFISCLFFFNRPAFRKAWSRMYWIWPLVLRNSSAAQASIASIISASTRRMKLLTVLSFLAIY